MGLGYPLNGIIGLVVAVAYIAFAWGAWSLQPWAWTIGIVVAGLGVIFAVVNFFMVPGSNFVTLVLSLLFPAVILYYLMTPDVRRAFGQTTTA
jgi:hypothetical protein